jgi:hypothetical protein
MADAGVGDVSRREMRDDRKISDCAAAGKYAMRTDDGLNE